MGAPPDLPEKRFFASPGRIVFSEETPGASTITKAFPIPAADAPSGHQQVFHEQKSLFLKWPRSNRLFVGPCLKGMTSLSCQHASPDRPRTTAMKDRLRGLLKSSFPDLRCGAGTCLQAFRSIAPNPNRAAGSFLHQRPLGTRKFLSGGVAVGTQRPNGDGGRASLRFWG